MAQPLWVFGASYASKRDPVGEKVYAAGSLWRMAPLLVLAAGVCVAWLIARIRRKHDEHIAHPTGSHQG